MKPGSPWSNILLAPSTTAWLTTLFSSLPSPRHHHPVAVQARQLVVALCSLAGEVFPRHDPAGHMKDTYLQQMLQLVVPWVYPVSGALQGAMKEDEGEVLDACRALSILCVTHKADVLAKASGALSPSMPDLFFVIDELTRACIAAGGAVSSSAPEAWLYQCTEMLLESWSSLLQASCGYTQGAVGAPGTGHGVPEVAVNSSAHVFAALTEASLKEAARGAYEAVDDDEDLAEGIGDLEGWMDRAAALARGAPSVTFPYLSGLLAQCKDQLCQCSVSCQDPSVALEQLCWLVRMAAHCLADSGEGEIPLVPEAVMSLLERGPEGAQVVERLSFIMLETAALCLQDQARPVLSPRLLECAIWSTSRWVDTYLLPEEPVPDSLASILNPQATQLVDMLVQMAAICLDQFPGEVQLHTVVCQSLLSTLVKRESTCCQLLSLESWSRLATTFTRQRHTLAQRLSQKLHRSLARSLCQAAAGCADNEAARVYLQHIFSPLAEEFHHLAHQPTFKEVSQRAEVELQLLCMLESLRGAAGSGLSKSQQWLCGMFLHLLPALLKVQEACAQQPGVVALVLKLAGDIVNNFVILMKVDQVQDLLQWVLQVLGQYSSSQLYRISLQTGQRLKEEQQLDKSRDLRALMKLLGYVWQRDLADIEEQEGSGGFGAGKRPSDDAGGRANGLLDVTQVVLAGLHLLLPLLSLELLKYPKLCQLYYRLLQDLLELHTEQVAALPRDQFALLMKTLEVGIMHTEASVCQSAMEGLSGLATYHYKSTSSGRQGLVSHPWQDGVSITAHMLQVLMRRILLEDTPQDLLELSADALLPLLLTESSTFHQLGHQLLSAEADAQHHKALGDALGRLMASNGVTTDLSRANKRRFRSNLCEMVASVRGLLRVR